jgi:copper homeostasis protein
MNCILEICAFSVEEALRAQHLGAHRIELCASPHCGGTTPSTGTLLTVLQRVSIPVWPIIRPKGGNFVYSEAEKHAMQQDILHLSPLGIQGMVIGALTPNGDIDLPTLKDLLCANPTLPWAFHKAFDEVARPLEALEVLINLGCTRILTAGGPGRAWDNRHQLKAWVKAAGGRIEIMAGGSVTKNEALALWQETGVQALHSSLREDGLLGK